MANTRRPKQTSHHHHQQQTTNKKQKPSPLITAAEYFLSIRNFTDTQTYAIRAQESDPTHPSPSKLLSIASVLSTPPISPTRPDYYTLLNLTPFETDITKIKSNFDDLTTILNPNTNKFPFSSEAFELVMKAWAVLSDPIEKAKFDQELKGYNDDNTFWTVCPYCYYVFEYERIYENCCVRCWNEECGRGFSSVAIGTPPKEVIEEGRYKCYGFVPVGGNDWVPFIVKNEGGEKDSDGFIIDISDDENGGGEEKKNGKKAIDENEGGEEKKNGKKAKMDGDYVNKFVVDGVEVDWSECLNIIGGETGESGIGFCEGKDDLFVGLDDFLD